MIDTEDRTADAVEIQQPRQAAVDDGADGDLEDQLAQAAGCRQGRQNGHHEHGAGGGLEQRQGRHGERERTQPQQPRAGEPNGEAEGRCQRGAHQAHDGDEQDVEDDIADRRQGHGRHQEARLLGQGEGLEEVVGVQAGEQGAQADEGRDAQRLFAQGFTDQQAAQGRGHHDQSGDGGEEDEGHRIQLLTGAGAQGTGATELQRLDHGRGACGAEPDEQDVEDARGDAVAGVIGAGFGLAEVVGDEQAINGVQRQRQDEAGRDRKTVVGIGAGAGGVESALGGAGEILTRKQRQAQGGDQAGTEDGGAAAYAGQRTGDANGEAAAGLQHVNHGCLSDAALRTALLLDDLERGAEDSRAQAEADGEFQGRVALPQPQAGGANEGEDGKDVDEQARQGAVQDRRVGVVARFRHVEARHGGFDPGEEDRLGERGDAVGDGVLAVFFRRQDAREHHQRRKADDPLQDIRWKITQQAFEKHY